MIGIYKITNPKGKIYIGQSTNIESRERQYSRLDNCKQQIRLYRSLKKYGYSNHTFEIVEECEVEELNARERYWQDFYNVLEEGLNLRLTETSDRSGKLSEETKEKMSKIRKEYNQTPEGKESRKKAMAHTDQAARVAKIDHKLRHQRVDYSKRKENTDYKARTINTDYKARTANVNWIEVAKKHYKPITQHSKEGVLLKEWESGLEAGKSLKIHRNCISACLRGKQKTAGGFIWKYKNT
jgi:group I intron endonuclease